MAEAREGCGGAGTLEAELTCPVCLGLYREPVSLSCGHSFCRQCIEEMLNSQQSSQRLRACPTCRAHLGPTLELQNNFKLGSIVEAFQATAWKGREARRESVQRDEGAQKRKADVIPCEHCLDEPQPAVKTCLVCEASLCQAHLSKHSAKGFHQEHVLVEVGAGKAEERRCRDHGKLLEFYCLREEKCICVLCSVTGAHKGHKIITMKEGHEKELVEISDTMVWLQASKSDLVTALEELQDSENQIKINEKRKEWFEKLPEDKHYCTFQLLHRRNQLGDSTLYCGGTVCRTGSPQTINAKTLASQLEELFKDIETELDQKKKLILSDIQYSEEAELAVVADVRKEMEEKRDQAEENLQALQKIKEQPDVFLFFKDLKRVTDRIAGLDLNTESLKVMEVQLDAKIMAQYQAQRKKFMFHLDCVLQDIRDQTHQISEAEQESPNEEEEHTFFLENSGFIIKPTNK